MRDKVLKYTGRICISVCPSNLKAHWALGMLTVAVPRGSIQDLIGLIWALGDFGRLETAS